MAALAALGVSSRADAAPGEVLILSSSVVGGLASPEAIQVANLGFTPVLVDDVTWAGMTTTDFASYEAIVLGDPDCQVGTTAVTAAEVDAATWAAAVDGNVIVIGTDPTWHIHFGGAPGAQVLNDDALAFVLEDAGTGTTGAYVSLSCYYHYSGGDVVAVLGGFGGFSLVGADDTGALNDVHIVASHPALAGLSDAALSNWSNSVHENFLAWPAQFEVLAMAVSAVGTYVAGDGTVGFPYILARGVIPEKCGDGDLDPGEECDDGNNADGDGCDAACNIECPDADGDGVCDDVDECPGGDDHVDADGDGVPDACDKCPGSDDHLDADGDGVPDACDICPGGDDHLDADADGVPDACDICPGGDDHLDADGDGVPDACDVCPGGDDHLDADGDGVPDACDQCPYDADNDADGDGICGNVDMCPGTVLPEGVPTVSLGVNRFADVDGDGIFDTTAPEGVGPQYSYTLEDTAGCSCEQIIAALGLGQGHVHFGCSISAMNDWLAVVSAGGAAMAEGDTAIASRLVLAREDAAEESPEDVAEESLPYASACSVDEPSSRGAAWAFIGLVLAALGRRRRSR